MCVSISIFDALDSVTDWTLPARNTPGEEDGKLASATKDDDGE